MSTEAKTSFVSQRSRHFVLVQTTWVRYLYGLLIYFRIISVHGQSPTSLNWLIGDFVSRLG